MAKNFVSKKVSGNSISKLMIAVIVVVFALGVFAVSGVIKDGIKRRAHEALQERLNSNSATIGERADYMGMELDEFFTYCGLENAGLSAKDEEQKAYEKMPLRNFAKLNGIEITDDEFKEFKTSLELGDDVTIDTTDLDIKSQYMMYYQMQQSAASAEGMEMGTDMVIDSDMAIDADTESDPDMAIDTDAADAE